MEKYIEVYSLLYDIGILNSDDYYELVSIYGSEVVNLVIEDLINEDEENIHRFDIDLYEKNTHFERMNGLSSSNIYKNNVNTICCLDADRNMVLMRKISEIIKKLEEIFVLFGCNDLVLDNGETPWIEDKIKYCLEMCHDTDTLDRLNYLFKQYVSIKNRVICGNLRLVLSIVDGYRVDSSTSFIEMVQNGNIGLMHAVEKYDISRGTSFSTYATIEIHRSIKNNLRKLKYPIRITQYRFTSYRMILKAFNDLSIQLGRKPTHEEVADYIGKSVFWIEKIMYQFLPVVYLDENDTENINCSRLDLIPDKNVDVFDMVYKKYLSNEIREILENNLTRKQLFVMMHYFGFYGKEYSAPEISKMLGVSNANVYRLRNEAMTRLRKKTNLMELFID